MQNLDRIALALAAVIILGGVIWSFMGADPGKEAQANISEYSEKIGETTGEQSGLPTENAPDVSRKVEDLFDASTAEPFPQWAFYRRPATFSIEIVKKDTPPTMEAGGVCRVEVIRDASEKRTFHRISGVRGLVNETATLTREVLHGKTETGEWTEMAVIPAGEPGDPWGIELDDQLICRDVYQYRLATTATATNKPFPEGPTKTEFSAESDGVLYPCDEEWECTLATVTSATGPGRATITRYRWNWEENKVERKQASAVEGERKPLFDTDYVLDWIRDDSKPTKVRLRSPTKGRLTLLLRVKAPTLTPAGWESTDGPCGTGDEEEISDGDNSSGATPPPTPPSGSGSGSSDDDDDDAGGLFGGDD